MLVSTQSLVVIAVDRFVAVVLPLRVSLLTSKRCPLCIVSIWIASMLLNIPYLLANILVKFDGKFFCVTNWKEFEGLGDGMSIAYLSYLTFATLLVYFPSALLIILYATIFTKLNSQKIPGEGSTYSERQRVKRNRKVLRMAVAIVFTFILCQLPGTTTVLVFLHKGNSLNCEFLIYLQILLFVAYSAVNPCICLAFSGNYRQGLKKALKYFSCPAHWRRNNTLVFINARS